MRKLSESVWGSIRKKSLGQEDRAEDGLEKFCEKLQSMYETPNSKGRITIQDDKICVYIFKNKLNMYTTLWIENVEKDRDYVTLAGTNPAKYRFSPSTMPLKVHTLGIYAVIKNNFKVEETESDGLEHWLHLKISHKDGSIFTNNDCINLIDLILNSIEDGKGIFPLISKNVNESVWGDIRKKSIGQEERIEDSIDNLDPLGFYEYIVKRYYSKGWNIRNYVNSNEIAVPFLLQDGVSYSVVYKYSESEKAVLINKWVGDNLIQRIKDTYMLKTNKEQQYVISPLDGSEPTNKFFMNVIEFIIQNADKKDLILFRKDDT